MHLPILIVIILGIASALGHTLSPNKNGTRMLYEQFKRKYNKITPNDADELRFAIFQQNLKRIEEQQKSEQGTAQYGITQFSDLTAEEFKATVGGSYVEKREEEKATLQMPADTEQLSESVDYRNTKYVGPVVNQYGCGSGWALSAVENIEAQIYHKTGGRLELSTQQLIDCDPINHGCHGGNPRDAYKQISRMEGLMAASDYPYNAHQWSCEKNQRKLKVRVTDFRNVSSNEMIQAQTLAQDGPLSVMLNSMSLQFYIKGVMHPTAKLCAPNMLDHAALTVGYGTQKKKWSTNPYWIVKNSWGVEWGEQGYFRIYRGDGTCGIDRSVSIVTEIEKMEYSPIYWCPL